MTAMVGEIRYFSFGFIPSGWLPCDGSTRAVRAYPMLYALLGNRFGGDQGASFVLPNMQGGAFAGIQPDFAAHLIGAMCDPASAVELDLDQLPSHSHAFRLPIGAAADMTDSSAGGAAPTQLVHGADGPVKAFAAPGAGLATMSVPVLANTSPTPPSLLVKQPYTTLLACICAVGELPTRPTPTPA